MNRANIARMRPLERKELLDELSAMVISGEIRLGEAVRVLRSAVLGMDRETFARVVKISKRALAKLEDSSADANPTLKTLTKVFKPFGGNLGLVFAQPGDAARGGEARRQRRAEILAALARSRRRRPGSDIPP